MDRRSEAIVHCPGWPYPGPAVVTASRPGRGDRIADWPTRLDQPW